MKRKDKYRYIVLENNFTKNYFEQLIDSLNVNLVSFLNEANFLIKQNRTFVGILLAVIIVSFYIFGF